MKRASVLAIAFLVLPLLARAQTAAPLSSRNEAFVRACIEHVNKREIDAYMDCWADNVSNNGQTVPRDRVRSTIEDIIATFPNFEWRILDVVADADTVVVLTRHIGTHRGVATGVWNGGGLRGVAATGKQMNMLATHWWTLRDGKVVEQQAVREDLVMMRQLGLAPDPRDNAR